jgi:hypothetical protein
VGSNPTPAVARADSRRLMGLAAWETTGSRSRPSLRKACNDGLDRRGFADAMRLAGAAGQGSRGAVRAVGRSGCRRYGCLHGARSHGPGRIRAPLVSAEGRRDRDEQGHRRRRRRGRNDWVVGRPRRARGHVLDRPLLLGEGDRDLRSRRTWLSIRRARSTRALRTTTSRRSASSRNAAFASSPRNEALLKRVPAKSRKSCCGSSRCRSRAPRCAPSHGRVASRSGEHVRARKEPCGR